MKKKVFSSRLNLLLLLIVLSVSFLYRSDLFAGSQLFPSGIIALPENQTAVIVEKKTQTLFLYISKANDSRIQTLFQFPCSTGEVFGMKQKAGDKKTPEGIYFLNDEYEDKYLSPVYGKKAFPTDYPNFIDRRTGKDGSAIWIHGTNKKLKPMDSNGCIALDNTNIIKLSEYVTLNSTPVIIVEKNDQVEEQVLKNQKENLIFFLNQWIQAVEKGSYQDYLSFYSPEYLPDISWWEQWLAIRKHAASSGFGLKVKHDNTGIYHYDHVFVIMFDYFLFFENKKILLGKRKLFLENQNGNYKIIGDLFQQISKKYQNKKAPLVAAAQDLVKPISEKSVIVKTIKSWLAAWSARDMDKYASFYAAGFYSDGMNKKSWVNRKKRLADKYDFIRVSGRRFKVKIRKKTCQISFFQEYESSMFSTQGTKKLKLVNKGGLWKIYQESWKEK